MYDDISCAEPLPFTDEMKDLGLDINDYVFQTKDLDCVLGKYIIQEQKLFELKYKTEKWIESSDKLFGGYMEREGEYLECIPYHGEIYFYDFRNNVQDKWDCWIEFKAIFTNGSLQKIELVKFNKEDNSERLEREKKWKEQLEHSERVWYNKYFRHTKAYHWFAHKVWYSVTEVFVIPNPF